MSPLTRVVLLGPPGAGKGTQAKRIAAEKGLVHLSTGDILRDEVAKDTDLGRKAKGFMDRGELVPDRVILDMIGDRIAAAAGSGFVLDGFPRTVAQAEALEAISTLDVVLNIDLPREDVVARLTARRVCERCGRIYNLAFRPPSDSSRCEACGGSLVQRDDDREEVIRNRYDVYEKQTAPLIAFYRDRKLLTELDGRTGSDDVYARVLKALAV